MTDNRWRKVTNELIELSPITNERCQSQFFTFPENNAIAISLELGLLDISPVLIEYSDELYQVRIIFYSKEDMRLYQLLGVSRSSFVSTPKIICEVE